MIQSKFGNFIYFLYIVYEKRMEYEFRICLHLFEFRQKDYNE
jgi:hypothetical protein